jgi:hypothetical protein
MSAIQKVQSIYENRNGQCHTGAIAEEDGQMGMPEQENQQR